MLLNWYIGLIVRPVSTLREIVDARPLGLGLLTLLIVTILNGIVTFGLGIDTATFEEFTDENIAIGPAFVVVGAILFTIFTAIGTVLFTLVVHLISRLFGGNGAYTGMLAGLMIISILSLILVIPGLLDALASAVGEGAEGDTSPFEVISNVISIVVVVWSVILGIILIRENYRLSTGMAVLSGIVSYFAVAIIGIIFFFMLLFVFIAIAIAVGITTGGI